LPCSLWCITRRRDENALRVLAAQSADEAVDVGALHVGPVALHLHADGDADQRDVCLKAAGSVEPAVTTITRHRYIAQAHKLKQIAGAKLESPRRQRQQPGLDLTVEIRIGGWWHIATR